jgi:glyoxylase-like metal-dependent hydrolase (beta-lactamase superfamily II)
VGDWREVGDDVFVRRYPFLDSNVGAVLGEDGVLVVDTRTSHRQADEILADLRKLTALPVVHVVNTHVHYDHTFGNARFPGAALWGHERCAAGMREGAEDARRALIARFPAMAEEFAEVVVTPPDRTFIERSTVAWGGRIAELRFLGRGHTDSDIVIVVADRRGRASSLFVGDLLENGAPPSFGDAYPLDWPATASAILALESESIVPGHGEVVDRSFAAMQADDIAATAGLARDVHVGDLTLEEAVAGGPFPPETMREALTRALAQLSGTLR